MEKLNPLGIGPKIGRIAIPYLAAGITLTLFYPRIFSFGPLMKFPLFVLGILLLALGLVLYLLTAKSLLKGLRNNKMMTSGVFRFCQNPLYAVMILIIIPGIALALNSWIVLTTSLLAYFIFKKSIRSEYEEMEHFFGEDYRKYKESTPEFFPFLKKFQR